MKYNEILKRLRKEKKLSQADVAEFLGKTQQAYSKYENGLAEPDIETLKKLQSLFDIDLNDFINNNSNLNFNNLEPISLGNKFIKIPVYGNIPAGIPIEMIDTSYIEDFEEINADLIKNGQKYFCLKVRGDSMMPKFENGDRLIILQQSDCESGSFAAVSINHTECTFKKVIKHPNGITLQPLNPAYEPMFFSNKEVEELPITILGVVKEIRRNC